MCTDIVRVDEIYNVWRCARVINKFTKASSNSERPPRLKLKMPCKFAFLLLFVQGVGADFRVQQKRTRRRSQLPRRRPHPHVTTATTTNTMSRQLYTSCSTTTAKSTVSFNGKAMKVTRMSSDGSPFPMCECFHQFSASWIQADSSSLQES